MKDIPEIKQMSREKKLRVMEAPWEALTREAQSLQSPTWHKSVVLETEQRVQVGKEKILDWKEAKEELLGTFH